MLPSYIQPMKIIKSIKKSYNASSQVKVAFADLYIPPIFIYTMGKVGSSAIYQSLMFTPVSDQVLHLHFLADELPERMKKFKRLGKYPHADHIYRGLAVRRHLKKNIHRPIKIISLVRDPIALLISNLFQNPYLVKPSIMDDEGKIDSVKASSYLSKRLRDSSAFSYIYEWFDKEIKEVFGINVLDTSFPIEEGYAQFSKNNVELLVMRLEDLSEKGPLVISEFLNLKEPLKLKKYNIRSESEDKDIYYEVQNDIKIKWSLCEDIYSSKFVRHFYNEQLIKTFISRWALSNSCKR